VIKQFGDFTSSGEFGATHQPFVPGAGGGAQADMTLSLPQHRLDDRRMLLTSLDQWKRQMDASESVGGMSEFQSLAFDVLRRGVSDAFDLSKEDPRLIARYDTSKLLPKGRISTQWNNREHYADNAATLGKLLLMARRLCASVAAALSPSPPALCGTCMPTTTTPRCRTGMDYVGRPFDHAVSALIEDIEARGSEREDHARLLRRDGALAETECQRRPRSLGRSRAAHDLRRRSENGPGHRPVGPQWR
jgi:hypothetical protein